MNARFALLSASLSIALPLALAGCGNKGPLFLPEPAPVDNPATPAGTVPVEIEPPRTLPADEPTSALPDPTATDPLLDDPDTVPDSPPATGTADDGDD